MIEYVTIVLIAIGVVDPPHPTRKYTVTQGRPIMEGPVKVDPSHYTVE